VKKSKDRRAREEAGRAGQSRHALTFAGLAAFTWAVLFLVNYLVRHPVALDRIIGVTLAPLLDLSFRRLAGQVPALGAAVGVLALQLASFIGPGHAAVAWLRPGKGGRGEEAFFSALAGVGLFALAVLGAGLAGFYSAGSYALLTAAGLAVGAARWRALRALANPPPPGGGGRPEGPLPLWVKAGIAFAVLPQFGVLVSGFAPPHVSDELIYHLGYAKWYLENHRIAYWPTNMFYAWPQLDTMLYGFPVSLGLVFGVKWMHQVAGLLAVWGAWLLLKGLRREVRILSVLALASVPAVWAQAGRAFNDLFIMAFASGMFLTLAPALTEGRRVGRARAVLAGLFIGFAGGNKYGGLLLGLAVVPFLSPGRLVLAAVSATLAAGPWLAKNWLVLGNPAYPMFYGRLGGLFWDDHLSWRLRKDAMMEDNVSLIKQLSRLPAAPWAYPIANMGGGGDSSTGPLVAVSIALFFAGARLKEAGSVILFTVPTFLTVLGFRHLIHLLPLVMLASGRYLGSLMDSRRARGLILGLGTALVGYQALEYYPAVWAAYDEPVRVSLGQETVRSYLDRRAYPAFYFPFTYSRLLGGIDSGVPAGKRVLLLGGYGGAFYIDRPCIASPLHNRPLPIVLARTAPTVETLRKRFKQNRIEYVAVNRLSNEIFYDFWRVWDWGPAWQLVNWRDYWDRHAVKEWSFWHHYELYRLSPRPVAQPHRLTPGFEEEVSKLLLVMIRKREFQVADSLIGTMASLYPRNPTVWLRAGMSALGKGDLKGAQSCCAKVQQLAPRSNDLRRCLAETYIVRAKYEEALALLMDVVNHGEADDPQLWLDIVVLLERLGRTAEAGIHTRTYLRLKQFRPYGEE
jgi:hypothetical protein